MGGPATLAAYVSRFATRSPAQFEDTTEPANSLVHLIRRRDLRPVLAGEGHVGENVVARDVHEGAKLGLLLPERVGDDSPLGLRFGLGILGEDRLQHRRHRRALLGRGVRQGVAHPVNPAALMGGVEDAAR